MGGRGVGSGTLCASAGIAVRQTVKHANNAALAKGYRQLAFSSATIMVSAYSHSVYGPAVAISRLELCADSSSFVQPDFAAA
jgi:hypothetical protein